MVPKITIEQYITDRVDEQYRYYSAAASKAKHRYYLIKVVEISLAATVPFLSALTTSASLSYMKVMVGVIGVLITAASGMLLLYKFHETWINYRSTAQALLSEKYLFLSRSGLYKGKAASPLFIERIEMILGIENRKWESYMAQEQPTEEVQEPETKPEPLPVDELPAADGAIGKDAPSDG
jgi:hypothetical protein